MQELVAFVARALVDHPDAVEVTEVEERDATVLQLRVAAGDLGKVIGRGGRTARALRTLVSAAGSRARKRLVLDILD
ncbi:MAG TPA: KH domain-containing protein [Myxococcota bacterium]|jgi:hypothetical protein|nr:KH domain-containing protein [Myxococcota bacterium]